MERFQGRIWSNCRIYLEHFPEGNIEKPWIRKAGN